MDCFEPSCRRRNFKYILFTIVVFHILFVTCSRSQNTGVSTSVTDRYVDTSIYQEIDSTTLNSGRYTTSSVVRFPGHTSPPRRSNLRLETSAPTTLLPNDWVQNELPSCYCMEYWKCVMNGGAPYSYCGLTSSNVCCFMSSNSKPIKLLPSVLPKLKRCGRKGPDSNQSGQAAMAEWRWHAAVLEKPDDLYICGASLVDQSWVMTAAHCVDDYLAANKSRLSQLLKIRLGEYDVTTTAEPLVHEEFDVADIRVYPTFNNSTLEHDIAILRLSSPARRRQHIDVVCLPRPGDFMPVDPGHHDEDHECFVTGWGRRSETGEHSVILKEVSVPIWSNYDCERALKDQFGVEFHLPNTTVCAGTEGNDACDGDGGGPLVCLKGGKWYQVGVVSYGVGCGRRHMPGVYTRVAMYENWIHDIILEHRKQQKQNHTN